MTITNERRARRSYPLKLEQTRDANLIAFLDQVKHEIGLMTFCRAIFRDYMSRHQNQITLNLDLSLSNSEAKYKKYFFQADKERDKDIINFLDQVRKEIDLSTFFREVLTEYLARSNGNLKLTIDLEVPEEKVG